MGYIVLTLMGPLFLLTTIAQEYVIPLIFWNLGFWVRFAYRRVNLQPREKAALLVGIPLDRVPPELGGAMLQITAWFFLVEFAVLSFLVQNPNKVLGVFTLLMWPSMFGALWIVKRIARKLD